MTPHAVTLLMARDATLQVLASGLGMTEDPDGFPVMEGSDQAAPTAEAHAQVTLPAERLGIVAGGAVADPAVGLRSMGCHEVQRVEIRGTHSVVAFKAGVF